MKNNIDIFEMYYEEWDDSLGLYAKIDGRHCFLKINIVCGTDTSWHNVVTDDEEYEEHQESKLITRIKKAIYEKVQREC